MTPWRGTPSKFRHNISYRNYDGGPSEDEKNLTICLAVSNIIHEHDRQKDTDGQPATTWSGIGIARYLKNLRSLKVEAQDHEINMSWTAPTKS